MISSETYSKPKNIRVLMLDQIYGQTQINLVMPQT